MPEWVEARAGAYADSVTLLQVTRVVGGGPGVQAAFVAMGTELNQDLVRGMGFTVPTGAGANELLVAIRAESDDALTAALAAVTEALTGPTASGTSELAPPRTTRSALHQEPADLVLVSVPGPYAFAEAADALDAGADVLVFSDNVPVPQELALKQRAAAEGRLVMGPDCGTAVIGGVGLGFANVVRPGPVGLVAASGTGAQQLLCLFDHAGVGVSACLGVGGRDLSAAIGGLSTLAALDLLDADPATELIVVVSKPPAAAVAERIRAHAASLSTPVQFALLADSGHGADLTAAAESALAALGRSVPSWPSWPDGRVGRPGALRGLFSGGTLCDEAMLIASAELGPIRSNIPLAPELALDESLRSSGHLMIDFGDDSLTAGRPHPMIDSSLRYERLAVEAADPSTGVVLLDVVLGHGAHPDPAAELAPAIAAAGDLAVVVSLVGSSGDPQDFAAQAGRLHTAGAAVFASNAAATRHAIGLVSRWT